MPFKTRLETKGFSEYLERLAKAGRDIDAVSDGALAAGGEVLLNGMTTRVPKDRHDLENSLGIDGPHQDGNFHYIEVGVTKPVNDDVMRYGNVQEFGSSNTPAKPYIRPTLDGDMSKARAEMKRIFIQADVGIDK